MNQVSNVKRPRRRAYSAEFKASVLDQCRVPSTSIAGIALGHGINPNMVHRWLREEQQCRLMEQLQLQAKGFVPLALQPPHAVSADPASPPSQSPAVKQTDSGSVRIEIARSGVAVTVHWPLSAAAQCAHLLAELLR